MVWIVATNHPENLGGAAVRGRRFTAKVEFELPGSINPAFTLSNSAVGERYQRKHEETAGTYYSGQMPFIAILARIAEHVDRL